mmetsp:Transcript_7819/g.19156  ORF Transcript_7819/g.19156 Transcript_7819/m.19156 type:complete len:245 (+) Transcript_7819:1407-2141(+)
MASAKPKALVYFHGTNQSATLSPISSYVKLVATGTYNMTQTIKSLVSKAANISFTTNQRRYTVFVENAESIGAQDNKHKSFSTVKLEGSDEDPRSMHKSQLNQTGQRKFKRMEAMKKIPEGWNRSQTPKRSHLRWKRLPDSLHWEVNLAEQVQRMMKDGILEKHVNITDVKATMNFLYSARMLLRRNVSSKADLRIGDIYEFLIDLKKVWKARKSCSCKTCKGVERRMLNNKWSILLVSVWSEP